MGAHHAPHAHTVASHATRLAGRGAFTAAAALALTGGTASLAFAHEAPQLPAHEVQSTVTDGAHQLSDAGKKVDTHAVANHGQDVKHKASDVASTLKSKASSSVVADMVTDGGHALSNTKNDLTHAKDNVSAAAEDGLTPDEASEQLGLVGDDVSHAVDNGKNDLQHWGSKLSSSAPSELPSVLSFGG